VATVIILVILALMHGRKFLEISGLNLRLNHILYSILITIITYGFASAFVTSLIDKHGISYFSFRNYSKFWILMPLFQVLNEEIIFRSLFIGNLSEKFKNPGKLSTISGGLFAIMHFILYYFGFEKVTLSLSCLTSLFLFGFITSLIFIDTRHIGYTFALHFGWNLKKFGGQYISTSTHSAFKEAQIFNIIEGSLQVLMTVLLFTIGYYIFRKSFRVSLEQSREYTNNLVKI